jgi:hypothetical protein
MTSSTHIQWSSHHLRSSIIRRLFTIITGTKERERERKEGREREGE